MTRREQVNVQCDDDEEVRFALDQHAKLDIYSASSLKQQSAVRHVTQLGTHYSDSSLCSFSFMLRVYWISNKYQLHSLWFDPTIYGTRGEYVSIILNHLFCRFVLNCPSLSILRHQ